ncbi:hypothetical protein ACN261_12800 [Micromonospora sp. WMMD723]|uniref:hypothetical protein n=1 Tax=Micromonospora sp. WMMD723 TaxID=3403465 RepID=UPI003CF9519E
MGALVTLDLPDDSPLITLPWIITFGPLADPAEWEPVVCGPYERPHALALAEAVVADERFMAVVEPLVPALSAEEIRGEIAASRRAAADEEARIEAADLYGDFDDVLDEQDVLDEHDVLDEQEDEAVTGPDRPQPPPVPTEAQVRAAFGRIAGLLRGR